MKIRIKGNSIRLRLSRSEVELFAKEGYLEEKTEFTNTCLVYAMQRNNDENISAEFIGQKIILYIPQNIAQQWISTNLVGLDSHMPLGDNKELYLLIEKDFKCIDTAGFEDQSDFYNNPDKIC